MFTDTKNLANLTANTSNVAAKQINNIHTSEDKFKLKKVWKPILRLMSRKSALTRNSNKRDHNSSIPNNIHLNNVSQCSTANKDTLTPSFEDSSHLTHKLTLAELWQTQQISEHNQMSTNSTQTLEFISKASIDKTPLDTCAICVYGRNCQHTQFHKMSDVNSLQSLHGQQQTNFNYFDVEDGCFVWSTNSADIDENVLREWLWQNSWQFAESATVC